MTKGPGRFEFYLIQLDKLLLEATKTDNPALYLYQNDCRTKAFMLEGLAKLYAGLHNEKKFMKIKADLKLLEDLLGSIDHYDSFAKEFLTNPEMPSTIRIYMEEKRAEKFGLLNDVLLKRKWISHDPSRTKKIRKRLAKLDWLAPEKEIPLIKNFYNKSINTINDFYKDAGASFTEIELQVHELRRKLRWLSIYPQALQGAIQYIEKGIKDDASTKYLTAEIVNSRYNVFPAPGNNNIVLELEKNYFLALSYTISELGKLKDTGLKLIATAEAVKATQFVSDEIAMQRACELNKMDLEGLNEILTKAKELCTAFFAERNLEKMLGEV
jgi:hypothetical protein